MMIHKEPSETTILVIDDLPENIQYVGSILRECGYEVMAAQDGRQGLQRARTHPPDLILLDVMMPEIDGFELCRQLKKDPITREIPIIFLTVREESEMIVEGLTSGAVDYITKPFRGSELIARVRTHLELRLQKVELELLNRQKDEFLAITVHDLRNPIMLLNLCATMILENKSRDNFELDQLARKMLNATERMRGFVNRLLNVNAIEHGGVLVNYGSCNLITILKEVVEEFQIKASHKNQVILLHESKHPLLVWADRELVQEVLDNLVSNAVKYSYPDSTIDVHLLEEEEAVRVEIKDRGPGLTDDDKKRVFTKFPRLSAQPTGGEKSVGLGLSIVKSFVEAMGGQVTCRSEHGQGATFGFTLPKQRKS